MTQGNCSLAVNEKKKLYIVVKREFSNQHDLMNNWYEENIDKLMPYIEFEFTIQSVLGNTYIEKITCGSGWDKNMKNVGAIAIRSLYVQSVEFEEKN